MERRRISRGERNRSLSVKELGQMFEELIRLTQTAACSIECTCRHHSAKYPNDQDQDSEINSTFTRIIRSREKSDGGHNGKPAAPNIAGQHVKNRKLFFEEQAHVLVPSTKNVKPKTEIDIKPSINTRYSSSIDLRSRSTKDTSKPCSVKTKKQLFEGYINGNEHKVTPSKSIENLHYRSKYYDDYNSSSSNLNGYIGGQKSNTMNDLLCGKYEEITTRDNDVLENNTNYNGISSEYNLLPEQNLTKQTSSEDKSETSSDEDDPKDFIAYQDLPPPPPLITIQNDALYQNLFPQLYEAKLVEVEGDVEQESDDLKYVQNLFVYFLRTDDAKESEIEPTQTARIVEIQDDVEEGNLIDITEENEISNPNARNVFNVSTKTITPITISSSKDEEEPIYMNLPSFEEEEPKQEIIDVGEEEPKQEIIDVEKVLNETYDENSMSNIEECISDVTEAFQSIQTLCDQPKWTIWDMAKQMHRFQEPEDDCDIFGTLLDIDSDYCLEAINSGNENVLFRISIGREVLSQESEDYNLLPNEEDYTLVPNETFYHEVDSNETITYEEPEYYTVFGTTYDSEKDMSGIYFDKDKNPRIEIIGGNKNQDTSLPQLRLPKLQYMIIKELIDSEENYLKRMRYIIDNYLIYFRNMNDPPDIEIVFGNIEEIYSETEKVYLGLKESASVDEVARVFLANVHLFDCYTEYLRNKSKAQQYADKPFADIIKKRQFELEDIYTCDSYLLNTIHRQEQYKLILERLRKAVTKNGESCESLDEAILLIDKKMAEANTALAVDSIKYCPCSLKQMGTFLMKEKFNVKKKYNSVVFLFQGGVVFCVEDQSNFEKYEYVECIEIDKLLLRHCSTSTSFQLSCFDKSKKYFDGNYDFDMEASSMAIKEKWVDEIQRILWGQLQYYKDQQRNAISNGTQLTSKPEILLNPVEENEYEYVSDPDEKNYENSQNGVKRALEDDEEAIYCTIEEGIYDAECTKMSGTFFDKNENPRIEIIRAESIISDNVHLQNLPKSQYMIIKELINTEETYLRKMGYMIKDYYLHFRNSGIAPDISIVFGNIETIYEETKRLYSTLLECNSIEDVAKVFLNNASIFNLYTDYLRNKSISYYYANTKFKDLIKDRQNELEDQYTCDSYLLTPVQRPGRYKLLLEKLEKEVSKTEGPCKALSDAAKLVSDKITEANTLMTIDSIKKCPIDLKQFGPFIIRESFNIKRKYKSVIFLFRDIVVFCTEYEYRPDTYVYMDSIEMRQLSISHMRSSTTFQLKNFDKFKLEEDAKYVFDIEAPSMSSKEKWIDEIQRMLWSQLQYFKDQQKSVTEIERAPSFVRTGAMKVKNRPQRSPSTTHKRSTFYYDIPSETH